MNEDKNLSGDTTANGEGTLSVANVQETAAETQVPEALAQDETPVKMPIFLGTTDPEIVDMLQKALGETADKYEIAMMAPDILRASTQNWFMSKLSSDERMRRQQQARSEEHRQDALKYGNELHDHFVNLNKGERFRSRTMFKLYELKQYYTKTRPHLTDGRFGAVGLSNKDTENVIDLLTTHGLITPTIAGVKKHEQVFAITVDPTSRLEYLQKLDAGYDLKQQELLARRQQINDEVVKISEVLMGNDADATPAEPEVPAKKKSAAKKAAPAKKRATKAKTAGSEQVAPGDAVNDR